MLRDQSQADAFPYVFPGDATHFEAHVYHRVVSRAVVIANGDAARTLWAARRHNADDESLEHSFELS